MATVRSVDVHPTQRTRHAPEGSNSLRECLPQHGIAARITWRAARGPARSIGKQESEHVHLTNGHIPRTEDRQAPRNSNPAAHSEILDRPPPIEYQQRMIRCGADHPSRARDDFVDWKNSLCRPLGNVGSSYRMAP